MKLTTTRLATTAIALAGGLAFARAQTPATPMPPAGMPPSGMAMPPSAMPAMMGGNMGKMMEATGPMMGAGGMGMPFEHVEGRIAYMKAELKITDAQAAPWDAYAASLRADAVTMKGLHDSMATDGMAASLPDRLAAQQKMMSVHLGSVQSMEASARPLYAALSEEQRKLIDQMTAGPMGMM